jgi:hypothetical protein
MILRPCVFLNVSLADSLLLPRRLQKNLILIKFIQYKIMFWTFYTFFFLLLSIFPYEFPTVFSVLSTLVKHTSHSFSSVRELSVRIPFYYGTM